MTWYHDQNRWGRQWFVGSLTGQTCLHQSYWILGHFLEQGMQIHLARPSLVALCNLFLIKNLSPQRKWFIYHWAETCIHHTSPRETRRCKKKNQGKKKQKTGETIIYCDNKPIRSWSASFSTWLLARDVFSTPWHPRLSRNMIPLKLLSSIAPTSSGSTFKRAADLQTSKCFKRSLEQPDIHGYPMVNSYNGRLVIWVGGFKTWKSPMKCPSCLLDQFLQGFFWSFLFKLTQANVEIAVANVAVTIPDINRLCGPSWNGTGSCRKQWPQSPPLPGSTARIGS